MSATDEQIRRAVFQLIHADSCYECGWGCESIIECSNHKCQLYELADFLNQNFVCRSIEHSNYEPAKTHSHVYHNGSEWVKETSRRG